VENRIPRPEDLEPVERASVDELRELQLRRLRESLRRAYEKVPHYRRAFTDAGVHPDDCRELADLAKVPFTDKADLRDNYPFGMFAVPREQVVRVHASSGTTGRPTVVGYTQDDLEIWAELMARSIHAAGGRQGDVVHVAYGYGLFTGGLANVVVASVELVGATATAILALVVPLVALALVVVLLVMAYRVLRRFAGRRTTS